MANAGQPDRQVEVDLTASPLESRPSHRGHGYGIEATAGLSVLDKLFKVGIRVQDKSAEITDGVKFMIVTMAVMIPPVVSLLVCMGAHASTTVTVWCSMGAGGVFTLIAFGWLKLCRREPGKELVQALPRTGQTVLQQKKRKYKGNKGSKNAHRRNSRNPRNRGR